MESGVQTARAYVLHGIADEKRRARAPTHIELVIPALVVLGDDSYREVARLLPTHARARRERGSELVHRERARAILVQQGEVLAKALQTSGFTCFRIRKRHIYIVRVNDLPRSGAGRTHGPPRR